jgi:hypothetical protein
MTVAAASRAPVAARRPLDRSAAMVRGAGLALMLITLLAFGAAPWLGFTRSLAVVTLAGYVATLVGTSYPAVGFLGIGVLCVLDAPARIYLLTGGLFRYNTLNYILLLVLVFGLTSVLRFRDVQTKLLLLLIVLLMVELLISPDLAFGVQHVFNVVSLLGLLIYFQRAAADRRTWIWFALTCGVAGAAGGFAFNLQQAVLPFANPNALAYFPLGAMFAVCLAFRFADEHARVQLLLAMLAGINAVWVFLTASRGSLLVATLCGLFLLLSTPSLSRRRWGVSRCWRSLSPAISGICRRSPSTGSRRWWTRPGRSRPERVDGPISCWAAGTSSRTTPSAWAPEASRRPGRISDDARVCPDFRRACSFRPTRGGSRSWPKTAFQGSCCSSRSFSRSQ